jgi:hypothetical protein
MPKSAGLISLLFASVALAADAPVTFNKEILPILQKNCQSCHRPGSIAPMSFLTYQQVRPWAKAITTAVASRKMPPWFADPKYGHFLNDRSLKQNEIATIANWADHGAAEGDPDSAPPPVKWPEGWQVQPDVIVQGPSYDVPAKVNNNVVEWISVTIPLCYGDWEAQHFIEPEDSGNLVEFANRICGAVNRSIAYIRMPVPIDRSDAAYFAPLRGLKLPAGTELYLGLVHADGADQTRKRIQAASEFAPQLGIATECGMARCRTPEVVRTLLKVHADASAERPYLRSRPRSESSYGFWRA